jgi:hypothetical protein
MATKRSTVERVELIYEEKNFNFGGSSGFSCVSCFKFPVLAKLKSVCARAMSTTYESHVQAHLP